MADTDWLEITPSTSAQASDDDWLKVEDGNAGRVSLAFQSLVDACMRGTNRVMACDGEYLAYRPFNREFDKETNPRTQERMNQFREAGHNEYVGTYDEVQIFRLLEGNPYRHSTGKQYVVGQNYWKDIRQAAKLAHDRNWSEYHDFLGAMATALKTGRDPAFAKTMWDDTVNQIAVALSQMPGAPTEKEVNDGFVGIRRERGIGGRSGVVLLNSSALQKVGFSK